LFSITNWLTWLIFLLYSSNTNESTIQEGIAADDSGGVVVEVEEDDVWCEGELMMLEVVNLLSVLI
jgi:hypothetical protein